MKSRSFTNYRKLPYNPALKERARELRKAGILAEVVFWKEVKRRKFKDLDFDRQKVIGNYIVDFFCSACNVVIEIDGSSHGEKLEYDEKRDKYFQSLGITVIRIPDKDVLQKLPDVMQWLYDHPAFECGDSGTTPP